MPTYPYACTACDHRFEQVQAFSDPSLTTCPVCGGRLRKVFSSVGIVFKGSGFYRNDARNGGSNSEKVSSSAESSGSGPGESSGSGETRSEGKGDTTTESKSSSDSGSSSGGATAGSGSSGSSSSTGSSAKSA